MSYLENLEHEYILGDAKLFREFDSSHFISNAKTVINNKPETVKLNMKFDYYTSMIEKAIQSFQAINLDKSMVTEFVNNMKNIPNIETYNIMVKDVDSCMNGYFKPQYLQQYINMVGAVIDKCVKGEATDSDVTPYITGSFKDRVMKQVVKSDLPYCSDTKRLVKECNFKEIKLDNTYYKTKVLPFLTKYDTIKSETLTEANSVLNAIKETELTIKGMLDVINQYLASNSLDMKKVNQLNQISYNAIRGIIEIVSFVSFALIHKLNSISSTIVSFEELYVKTCNIVSTENITEAFNDSIVANDSYSLADELLRGNSDYYDTVANRIYEFHSGMPQSEVLTTVDFTHPYDKRVYEEVNKAYIIISKGLDIIATAVSDNFLLIFNDIVEKAGFTERLQDRFRNVMDMVTDISQYESAVNISVPDSFNYDIYGSMLNEVKDFGKNMDTIAKNALELKHKMDILRKRFESNINGEFSDSEAINELKIFMKELDEQLREMTSTIATGFMNRLKAIGDVLTKVEALGKNPADTSSTIPETSDSAIDFVESAFEEELKDIEEETKNLFHSLESSYYAEKSRVLRGTNVIFEADNAQPTNGTSTATNTAQPATQTNTQQPVNNEQTQQKTTPVVTDNSQQQNTNATETNNTGIANSISKWIEEKINQLIDIINKEGNKKYKKWLDLNKDNLMNRSYSNVAIKMLPYNNMPANSVFNDITSVVNNIKSLNPTTLQSIKSQEDLYRKIFPFMSGLTTDKLSDQIKNYYKTKTTEQSQVVTIANGDLKTFVSNEMLPFCTAYYNEYTAEGSSLRKSFNNLSSAVTNTLNSLNTGAVKESVDIFKEADDPNTNNNTQNQNNSDASLQEKSKWLASAIRYYCGAIMNALRERNKDYLKALDGLVPKISNNNQNNTQPQQNANQQPPVENNNQQDTAQV